MRSRRLRLIWDFDIFDVTNRPIGVFHSFGTRLSQILGLDIKHLAKLILMVGAMPDATFYNLWDPIISKCWWFFIFGFVFEALRV